MTYAEKKQVFGSDRCVAPLKFGCAKVQERGSRTQTALKFSSDHGNSTQRWHDFKNIKAKRFSPPTDSKFRADAPPQPLMMLWRRPLSLRLRRAAKWSSRFKLGPPGAPALAGWPSPT